MPWTREPNCVEVQEEERLKALHEAVVDGLKHGSRPGKKSIKMFYTDYEDESNIIKNLIMTGDDIDLEKILCLHIMSVTTAPVFCRKLLTSTPADKITPYSSVLPTFIAFHKDETELLCNCWNKENKKKIGRLRPFRTHLALDRRIEKVIKIALDILLETNCEKLQKLSEYSHNLEFIKSLLKKEKNLIFITALHQNVRLNYLSDLRIEPCIVIKATSRILYELEKPKRNLVFTIKLSQFLLLKQNILFEEKGNEIFIKYAENLPPDTKQFFKTEDTSNINLLNQRSFLACDRQLKSQCSKSRSISLIEPLLNKWPFENKLLNIDKELKQVEKFNEKYLKDLKTNENNKSTNTLTEELPAQKLGINNNFRQRKKRYVMFGKDKFSKTKHLFPQIKPRQSTPNKERDLTQSLSVKLTGSVTNKSNTSNEGLLFDKLDLGKIIYCSNENEKSKGNGLCCSKNKRNGIFQEKKILEILSMENIFVINEEVIKIKNELKLNRLIQSIDSLKPFKEEAFSETCAEKRSTF